MVYRILVNLLERSGLILSVLLLGSHKLKYSARTNMKRRTIAEPSNWVYKPEWHYPQREQAENVNFYRGALITLVLGHTRISSVIGDELDFPTSKFSYLILIVYWEVNSNLLERNKNRPVEESIRLRIRLVLYLSVAAAPVILSCVGFLLSANIRRIWRFILKTRRWDSLPLCSCA